MRYATGGIGTMLLAEEQKVRINGARAVTQSRVRAADTPEGAFQPEHGRQQTPWTPYRREYEFHHLVQKPRLLRIPLR